MAKIKMPAGKAGKHEINTDILASNWSTSLAINNSAFRQKSNYWYVVSPRRIRRKLKRAAKKAGANHG